MERWSKIAEWFDLNREKITLVAGGIGVVFSLLGVRLGLPFRLGLVHDCIVWVAYRVGRSGCHV